MSASAMLMHLILERLSRRVLPRVPETGQIMNDLSQNSAFAEAGCDEGILTAIHFYHALQITPVIQPGDRVLDLACGPANQLAQIARINPHAHFTGMDASASMLDSASDTLLHHRIGNVELMPGDMTLMPEIKDASMDCVICTMSLHHLPDLTVLSHTLRETRRILKPGGGFYFVDFGRLKRTSTQRFFSEDRRTRQSALFTQDYFNSMRAAFSVQELSDAAAVFGSDVVWHSTLLAPFMVVFKSADRCKLDAKTWRLAQELYSRMTAVQQRDFQVFARWFRAGGYDLPFALA